MSRRERPALLVLAAVSLSCSLRGAPDFPEPRAAGPTYQLVNGQWYDGTTFVRKSMWTLHGRFSDTPPIKVDSVLDLAGGYVVPPFAEAHTHNIGCPPTPAEAAPYVRDGIQFVMVQSPTFPPREVAPLGRTDVDVVCAGALLTPSGSHITRLNEQSASRGNFPGLTPSDLDGRTHSIIDTRDDLYRKLGPLLAARPAFIKVVLAFSEEWDRRHTDSAFIGMRGLDPTLLPWIVRRAHAEGVKVSAHIETAADFRVAVASGVDLVAHLPGQRIGHAAGFGSADTTRWLLTDDDARRAAARHVVVVTTVVAAKALLIPATQTSAERESMRTIHRANIATLRARGVELAVGSDFYNGTSLLEVLMLGRAPLIGGGVESLGALDNGAVLHLWSVETPRAIFPQRRIGVLESGYEANLLVLSGNPIDDLRNVRRIALRMKAGRLVP